MSYQQQYGTLKASLASSEALLRVTESQLQMMREEGVTDPKAERTLEQRIHRQHELIRIHGESIRGLEALISAMHQELKDNELQVFELRFMKGWTVNAIASEMHYSRERIKQIVRRVQERMRA